MDAYVPDGIAGSACAKAQVDAKGLNTSMSSEDITLHRRREVLILNRTGVLLKILLLSCISALAWGAQSSATRVVIWISWCQGKSGEQSALFGVRMGHPHRTHGANREWIEPGSMDLSRNNKLKVVSRMVGKAEVRAEQRCWLGRVEVPLALK